MTLNLSLSKISLLNDMTDVIVEIVTHENGYISIVCGEMARNESGTPIPRDANGAIYIIRMVCEDVLSCQQWPGDTFEFDYFCLSSIRKIRLDWNASLSKDEVKYPPPT